MERAFEIAVQATVFGKDVHTTQLNEWPMLMVHNAATTYLPGGILHQINNWAKTQPDGGISGLLDCGARCFLPRVYKSTLAYARAVARVRFARARHVPLSRRGLSINCPRARVSQSH